MNCNSNIVLWIILDAIPNTNENFDDHFDDENEDGGPNGNIHEGDDGDSDETNHGVVNQLQIEQVADPQNQNVAEIQDANLHQEVEVENVEEEQLLEETVQAARSKPNSNLLLTPRRSNRINKGLPPNRFCNFWLGCTH